MNAKIVILAASLALVGMPLAAADEGAPDCEANQPWIGYNSSKNAQQTYQNLGSPGGVYVCEGEHWDGQDTVQPSQNPGNSAPCATSSLDPSNFFVGLCMGPDPNGPNDPTTSLTPVVLRVSAKGGAAYTATNIFAVGDAVVYTDGTTTAVYLRDNTPGNVLATAVSAPGITQGFVSEGDCNQATYQAGAEAGDRTKCGRDNTAVTVRLLA